MKAEAQQTLGEIHQLISQYLQEVPGRRRAWPESIKSRIARLGELGLSPKEIASRAGLSYFTILKWIPESNRRRYRTKGQRAEICAGHFAPVQIRKERPIATVTVAKNAAIAGSPPSPRESATVTVTLPNGIRVDGVTAEFLKSWLGARAWE